MPIKVTSIKTLPAVELDHIQFNQLSLTTSTKSPYITAISAKVVAYGQELDGTRTFDRADMNISIPDLTGFIMNLSPELQVEAMAAMQKVQEGLGVLAELNTSIEFVEYG